jgi:23S rRNA pseudouridine1911/1915/1917 synthase
MKKYMLEVDAAGSGKRLDMFIADFCAREKLGFSRTAIQKMILDGKVVCEGVQLPKPHTKIKTGQQIQWVVEEKKASVLSPEDIPFNIEYEDDDLAVIYKPAGLVVHPAPGNATHTLVNALLHSFEKLSDINPGRPGIVHRLDKDTSGLLVIAKTNFVHLELAKQFAEHSITRKYIALVRGSMEYDENIIEVPIGRHPIRREKMSARFGEHTKYAKTHYRTLLRAKSYSLLELLPYTGRTHQLRVHLAFLGHPILGDPTYGKKSDFCRLALHAKTIGFMHPARKKYLEFSTGMPAEFEEFLRAQQHGLTDRSLKKLTR